MDYFRGVTILIYFEMFHFKELNKVTTSFMVMEDNKLKFINI